MSGWSLINEINAWLVEGFGKSAKQQLLVVDENQRSNVSAMATMKFWEMKGLTITDIENTFNFDFVVTDACIPVITNGQFVVLQR